MVVILCSVRQRARPQAHSAGIGVEVLELYCHENHGCEPRELDQEQLLSDFSTRISE